VESRIFAALLIGEGNLARETDRFTSCFRVLWVSPFGFSFLELVRKGDFRYTLAGFTQIRRLLIFHWSEGTHLCLYFYFIFIFKVFQEGL
jgi:hypothetical protein